MIHRQKKELMLLNMVCGGAVLFSYAHGLISNPSVRSALWGGIPQWLMPFYAGAMPFAAVGYFLFTSFILLQIDPDEAVIAGRYRYRLFHALYGAVLVPSALWMPLSLAMLHEPSVGLWIAIRLVLTAVGLGSIGISAAIFLIQPRRNTLAFRLAVIGSIAFCVQTAILDALVWTALFPFSLF